MRTEPDIVETAIQLLPVKSVFRKGEISFRVMFLLPEKLWRPLKADWWTGKEVCIIGGDPGGNYFLRHCNGTVRLWNHGTKTDEVIGPQRAHLLVILGRFMTSFERGAA